MDGGSFLAGVLVAMCIIGFWMVGSAFQSAIQVKRRRAQVAIVKNEEP